MANIEGILQQLRDERDQLDRAINALSPVSRTGNGTQRRRAGRRFRVASIAKMRAAQHARRTRERSQTHSAKNGRSRARRRISPAGLARIRAAQRARWAKVRAGKKK